MDKLSKSELVRLAEEQKVKLSRYESRLRGEESSNWL